jgi:hypothetical protein
LVLDVPKEMSTTVLPRAEPSSVVQRNLSELHSAPGRQAASLIRTTHLRSLASSLSAVATATSLAETNPSVAVSSDGKFSATAHVVQKASHVSSAATNKVMFSENDPLRCSEKELALGYSFTLKVQPPKSAAPRRKSSSNKELASMPTTAKSTKKKVQSSTQIEAALNPKSSEGPSAPPVLKTERKRKAVRSDSVSRATQRRKPSSKQAISVPARNVMQQQQQQTPDANMLANRASFPRQQSLTGMEQQPNPYNQFMKPMQSPPSQSPAQRASFQQQLFQQQSQQRQPPQQQQQQFQTPQQMAQLRMMQQQQQQQQQQSAPQQGGYGQGPHGMQQMPQFFPPTPQQQFAPQPMPMPGQVGRQPGTMPMNLQGNNAVRQNRPTGDDQNDPLFMLKDM